MRRLQEPTALRLSPEEVQEKLQAAVKDWKNHKKNQHDLREKFELQGDKQRARIRGTTVECQTKQRKNSTATRCIFRRIRTVMNPREQTCISTVEFTADNGLVMECRTKTEIETACITEGQKRFTQAAATPFLQGTLLEAFGYNANPLATRDVLNGTFIPGDDVTNHTRSFIAELRMPNCVKGLPQISGVTTTDDHCTGWKRMRARTGSSRYSPLFCDYIAGTHDRDVAEVDASLSSIPYLVGFSPALWQEATDVMIPKKKSSRHVEKLRIIVLFDAMFNMVNKRIARTMINRAQALRLLPDEVYGGAPRRRATTCSLNKILALDIIRMERRTASVCSNDAKSCYDRIVHTVASICMQRLGVSEEACFTIFGTLQELNHHVRTAFGERARGYGALHIPLHGVGQGNGAGPAIWLAITIPLISMLRKAGFGLHVVTPISKEETSLACFVYVDDVDSIHSPIQPGITASEIAADMQCMLDTWSAGLHATGGMIEWKKSYWYLIDFKWNHRKLEWEYKSVNETPATIYLRNPGLAPIPLSRKEVWEADPDGTLGTYIAMDGNQEMVLKSLTNKVDLWADKIRSRQLTTTEGWLCMRTGITMSIEHQLSTSRLTKQQCMQITRRLKRAALKASGIPLTFPDLLVYSPREYLGLGLPNLWHIQAFLFARHCLQHGSLPDDPTGILLRNIAQNMRLELGVSKSPTTYPFKVWHKCATHTQFFPFWEYASDTHLELHDGLSPLPTARTGDKFIMEAFADYGFSAKQLKLLNLCRLYLQILLLSDLTTGDGKQLDRQLMYKKQPFQIHSRYRWPPAHKPNNHCWRFWHDALLQCFVQDHHQAPFCLQEPLGSWTTVPQEATTFYSSAFDSVYVKKTQTTFQRFCRQNNLNTRFPLYTRDAVCSHLPQDVVPTTVHGNHGQVRHTGFSSYHPKNPSREHDWWGIVSSSSLQMADLARAIKQGTAVAVTDGSYKDGMGTAAFTFRTGLFDKHEISLVHMTPGQPEEITPYRAEMSGIFGIASFLQRVHHDCAGGTITVACDCKAALDNTLHMQPPKPDIPNADLLLEIYQLKAATPITWKGHWVRGHQDDTTQFHNLDTWAQLNITMDKLAKAHWSRLNVQRPMPFSLPSSVGTWSIWQHGQRITCWDRKTSDLLYFNSAAKAHWANKYATFHSLDYEAICMAYKSSSLYYQLRIPKWIGRWLPVGNRVVKWSHDKTSECPRCDITNESHLHILSCQHPGATALVTQWMDDLELWLVHQHTQPQLRTGIISLLKAGFNSTIWRPPRTTDPFIQETFQRQQHQGTDQAMFGWWSQGWAEAQQMYLLSISRRESGKRWLSRLIKKQWEVSWDLWRHRLEVAASPNSFSLARAHEQINIEIQLAYANMPAALHPPLQRWFRQQLAMVLQETLTFKKDWLAMVRSFPGYPAQDA
jgi:hypothetical protein